MRVGILTFHRAVNYGAVLQAYALQKKVEEIGCDAQIIDYRCDMIEKEVSPLAGFRKKEGFVKASKQLVFRTIKNAKFNQFMNKYLNLSERVRNKSELSRLDENFDYFITGSDQVWNFGCSGSDTSYFLDFVKKSGKKISYAASFGYDKLPENDPFDYAHLLEGYKAISVREKSAVGILDDKIETKAQVTLDPTLLLKKDEWKKLVKDRPCKEKYIFIYYIRKPKDLLNYAYKLAQKHGYKVVNSKKDVDFLKKCSPQDFLTWIYHAEYFITNSFHGTVFSVLFEKQFMLELDNGKSVNNRSKELLKMIDLNGRELDIKNLNAIDEKIDFKKSLSLLEENRKQSLQFLVDNLK